MATSKKGISPNTDARNIAIGQPHELKYVCSQFKKNREHLIKVANYCEIRDRMKKAGVKNPLDLALEEKDDPVKPKRRKL